MAPVPLFRVRAALLSGNLQNVLRQVTPADTFYLTASFRRNGTSNEVWGSNGKELDALIQQNAAETSAERISSDFGVPHPVLALNYARELLDVEPFPAFMGYSSRLLAESWDSNNLYWARLADERGLPPAALNRAPQLTRRMVEKIFATDFEDWAALLRATRETGDEFRQGKFALLSTAAAPQR